MSVTLKDILTVVGAGSFRGDPDTPVSGVTHDSRRVVPGWAFVAVPGVKSDGVRFVEDAIKRGAAAIVSEREPESVATVSVELGALRPLNASPWVTVSDARKALGRAASAIYGYPTSKLALVGITGTNGKTTCAYLLESVIKKAGGEPGVMGTINYRWRGNEFPAARTTPEASDIQRLFAEMLTGGVTHGLMEASSHGLALDRLEGCRFDVGVFTNLTQDHLDFHGGMEDYYLAKKLLFARDLPNSSKPGAQGVVNWDDPYGKRLFREVTEVPLTRFGVSPECEVRALKHNLLRHGIEAVVRTSQGDFDIRSKLSGFFNLMNILAATAASLALGFSLQTIAEGVAAAPAVPGRLERIESCVGTVFVDYAHTPLALRNVLDALKGMEHGRIITVMGCGGDRDRTKRPLMGREAALGSDIVVVTSDNPRTEDPDAIIAQVAAGIRETGFRELTAGHPAHGSVTERFRIIPDRREALRWAVESLCEEDILLAAGKGHETYQEIMGVRHPFDDGAVLRHELADCDARVRARA